MIALEDEHTAAQTVWMAPQGDKRLTENRMLMAMIQNHIQHACQQVLRQSPCPLNQQISNPFDGASHSVILSTTSTFVIQR